MDACPHLRGRNCSALCVPVSISGNSVGVFHVTDGEDFSVAQMIRALAQAFDKPARLLPVPASWLRAAGALTGRTAQVDRLTSPLRMDSTRLRTGLGWTPPTTVAQGIARTVRAFQEARG